MNKKGLLYVCIYLILVIGVFSFYSIGKYSMVFLISSSYVFFYLCKSLILIIKKQKKPAILCFFLSISFFLIELKLYYTYYNFVFVIFFIIASYFIINKRNFLKREEDSLVTMLILTTIINFSLLFFSNEFVWNLFDTKTVKWHNNISISDFQGVPVDSSIYDAEIDVCFVIKQNKAYNYPPAIGYCKMNKDSSWFKKNSNDKFALILLKHEQGHFDIKELKSRDIKDSIKKLWGNTSAKKIEHVVDYFAKKDSIQQKKYDLSTNHGANLVEQKKWNLLLETELKK